MTLTTKRRIYSRTGTTYNFTGGSTSEFSFIVPTGGKGTLDLSSLEFVAKIRAEHTGAGSTDIKFKGFGANSMIRRLFIHVNSVNIVDIDRFNLYVNHKRNTFADYGIDNQAGTCSAYYEDQVIPTAAGNTVFVKAAINWNGLCDTRHVIDLNDPDLNDIEIRIQFEELVNVALCADDDANIIIDELFLEYQDGKPPTFSFSDLINYISVQYSNETMQTQMNIAMPEAATIGKRFLFLINQPDADQTTQTYYQSQISGIEEITFQLSGNETFPAVSMSRYFTWDMYGYTSSAYSKNRLYRLEDKGMSYSDFVGTKGFGVFPFFARSDHSDSQNVKIYTPSGKAIGTNSIMSIRNNTVPTNSTIYYWQESLARVSLKNPNTKTTML